MLNQTTDCRITFLNIKITLSEPILSFKYFDIFRNLSDGHYQAFTIERRKVNGVERTFKVPVDNTDTQFLIQQMMQNSSKSRKNQPRF